MNTEWLSSFVAFAECLSFTQAARTLHISQPALHVQVQKLADSLGVRLYARRGRTLELTQEGQRLLAFGREQRERIDDFVRDLTQGTGSSCAVLAAGEGTFLYLLPEAIRTFQRSQGVTLRVLTRDRERAVEAVRLGEAHLAVTVIDEPPDGCIVRPVARVGAAVVLPLSHPLARKRRIPLRDLAQQPLVVPSEGRPLRRALASACAELGIAWSTTVEADGWELLLTFARLGLGLAVVNDFCAVPRGMVKRPLVGLPAVHYQLVRLRDRHRSAAVERLEAAILARRPASGAS
jgi:LysR family transcriptional regulator, low CO2-responsive transcriptional regulator